MTPAAVAPLGRMLLVQTMAHLRIRWRIPAFSVTITALPILFFSFFGLPFASYTFPDGRSVGAHLIASFGAYGVGSVMVYAFGIGVANERATKMDLQMRVTPLPPLVDLFAKMLTALVFGLASLLALIAFGVTVGGVHQPVSVWATIVLRLLAGSVPFIGLGFTIGYVFGPNTAPAMANLVYLPLSFASGLFMPVDDLPRFVRLLSPYLPNYHYAQLAWSAVGARTESVGVSLLWLAAYTALFLTLALIAYRREERRNFE